MVHITIDDREYEVEEASSVLEVAKAHGVRIPTMCYHPALRPSGACKLCAVEVTGKTGRQTVMLCCILKAREDLVIKTDGELVNKARTKAFRDLLQMAPQAKVIRNLAEQYGVDVGPPPDGCIRCRLCIRVCKEIVGPGALKMEKRGSESYVAPTQELCIGCGTCVNICPTSAIKLEDKDGVRTISIGEWIIGKHVLERCEACGRLHATQKFLSYVTERTGLHPDVKEHHQYCPTCAKLFSARMRSASKLRRL